MNTVLARVFRGHPSSALSHAEVRVDSPSRLSLHLHCRDGRALEVAYFDISSPKLGEALEASIARADDEWIEISLNAFLADAIVEWLRENSLRK